MGVGQIERIKMWLMRLDMWTELTDQKLLIFFQVIHYRDAPDPPPPCLRPKSVRPFILWGRGPQPGLVSTE